MSEGGTLCFATPLKQSVSINSGGAATCDGAFVIGLELLRPRAARRKTGAVSADPGQHLNVQIWGRDSVATGISLSDALEYFVCE